jgi:hypothetical protein
MQVCTPTNGKTVVMASGKPLSPSTTAIRMSSTPRLRSSFMTFSQNLAPLVPFDPNAQHALSPVRGNAQGQIDRFVPHGSLVADLHSQRVEIDHRIAALQRPILPLDYGLQHRISHRADEVGAHLHLVLIKQKALDLAHSHPVRIHRDSNPQPVASETSTATESASFSSAANPNSDRPSRLEENPTEIPEET